MNVLHALHRRTLAALAVAAVAVSVMVGAAPAVAGPVASAPRVSLSPASGPVGTTVAVSGTAFPKKAAGTLSAGDTRVAFRTSTTGAFTASVVVPSTTASTIDLVATSGAVSARAPFTLTYSPATTVEEPVPAAPTAPSTAVPAIRSAPLRFGVSTPGGPTANAELDAVARLAGESPSIVLSYADFGTPAPIEGLRSVAARGAVGLVTWEPWRWGGGSVQPAYTSARIAAGEYDTYLREWGQALAAYGGPVMLRYAHEMNGNWYPWADGVNGNAPGSYIAAWRHVHDVVESQGATNVSWVWSPNIPYQGATTLASSYPGAAYVDVVALDGYNWGTAVSWSTWTTAGPLFAPGLSQLRSLAPGKSIMVAETSSAETGGSKAAWIRDLVGYLGTQSDVTALVWFDHDKEVDWRINSSATSATAFREAMAGRPGA